MYNLKARITKFILMAVIVIVTACQDNSLEEISNTDPKADAGNLSERNSAALFDVVNLDQVELQLMTGTTGAAGTVIVEIKSMDNTLVGSSELPADSVSTVSSWVTFTFPGNTQLTQGEKYRIEVTRSHPPVTGNGQVFWRMVRRNAYAAGASDVSASYDYAFRTYANGVVDQEQPASVTVFPISTSASGPRWQEFVAGN